MAQDKYNTDLSKLILQCMTAPDPMLAMLEWLCDQLMEAEVCIIVSAIKNVHAEDRSGYRSGYRLVVLIPGWERCISWSQR